MSNKNKIPKRNKRRTLAQTFFAINLRNKLKQSPIEHIKITLEECKKELDRRSRQND